MQKAQAKRAAQEEWFQKHLDGAKERLAREDAVEAAKGEARDLAKQQRLATYAGAAANAAFDRGPGRGERAGAQLGSMAGMAAGEYFGGPVGAAVGQAVGQEAGAEVGKALDDPLLHMTAAFDAVGKAGRYAGEALTRVAGNDGLGVFQQAAGTAAEVLENIPATGHAAAAALRAFSGTVGAAHQVLAAFNERGRELRNLSGPIAGAAARQDVSRMLADMREAQRVDYARLIDLQTKQELFFRELIEPIKVMVVEKLPGAIDTLTTAVITGVRVVELTIPHIVRHTGSLADHIREARDKAAAEAAKSGDFVSQFIHDVKWMEAPDAPDLPEPRPEPPLLPRITPP